jgi:feruloyl esterase
MKLGFAVLPVTLVLLPLSAHAAATPCESLAARALPNAKIDIARSVPAGDFSFDVKRTGTRPQNLKSLPAFCRIAATLTPSSDSDIKVEVWLPEKWNGKFQAVGNGNWAGQISYSAMAEQLRRGYATASTDTGHAADNTDGSWSLNHPEKIQDFGWRSEHEMTIKAKALITAYYGTAPTRSYWNGCSTGGRQGLMAATRFPNDYDGIIAGDPANTRAGGNAWQLSLAKIAFADEGAGALAPDKLKLIHDAAVKSCDALDGAKDGLIETPRVCRFDPSVLSCKSGQTTACLTPAQLATTKAVYSPAKFSNGKEYRDGFVPGSELEWGFLVGPNTPPYAAGHFRYIVYKDPKWDWTNFDPDTAVPLAEKAAVGLDVTSTDFRAFAERGGKMIMYHGWNDQRITPYATVKYFESARKSSPKAPDAVRLFMVPAMAHCGGGEGPNKFDMVSALEQWVEQGKAPASIVASRIEQGKTVRTRPLCPYPQQAKYKGTGSIDDAANFACTAP